MPDLLGGGQGTARPTLDGMVRQECLTYWEDTLSGRAALLKPLGVAIERVR